MSEQTIPYNGDGWWAHTVREAKDCILKQQNRLAELERVAEVATACYKNTLHGFDVRLPPEYVALGNVLRAAGYLLLDDTSETDSNTVKPHGPVGDHMMAKFYGPKF